MEAGGGPGFLFSLFAFIASFSVLVFIHEWGHYRVAKAFGVRIHSFAIGFGKELAGWTDKDGVRWKFCLLPLGGYVRFAGDASAASNPDSAEFADYTEEEKAGLFHFKPLWQKALVVVAGPAVNLVTPILVFAVIALISGIQVASTEISDVVDGSAADDAGLIVGDRILAIDGYETDRFSDLQRIVQIRPGQQLTIEIDRDGERLTLPIIVGSRMATDRFDNEYPVGVLGIRSTAVESRSIGPVAALGEGWRRTLETVGTIGTVAGQLAAGDRSVKEVAGPIRIADMTGVVASQGFDRLVVFLAMISINLGLVNLLPIPGLDGGHLFLYGLEALNGGPLPERALEYGYRAGIGLLLVFMVFVFWNDLQSVAL